MENNKEFDLINTTNQEEGMTAAKEETAKETAVVVKPTTEIVTAEDVMESIENSDATKDEKVEKLCRWAAARAAVIVVAPLVGTGALIANDVYLVSKIAKVYDIKLSEVAVASFVGAIGGTVLGGLLTTLIPLSIVQIPVAVGITYAIGKVAEVWIKDGMPKDMTKYKPLLEEWMGKAKAQAKEIADDPWANIPLGDEDKEALREKAENAKTIIVEKATEAAEVAKEKVNAVKDKMQR